MWNAGSSLPPSTAVASSCLTDPPAMVKFAAGFGLFSWNRISSRTVLPALTIILLQPDPDGSVELSMPLHRSPTRAEIDLDSIEHNLGEIRRLLGPAVKIMAVVKADGYGHGAVAVARPLSGRGFFTGGSLLMRAGPRRAGSLPRSPARLYRSADASLLMEHRLTPTFWPGGGSAPRPGLSGRAGLPYLPRSTRGWGVSVSLRESPGAIPLFSSPRAPP